MDVLFPRTPGFEEKEGTAGGDCVVGHVAAGFGDNDVGPWKEVINEVVVGVNKGIFVEDADVGLGVSEVAYPQVVVGGKGFEGVAEVGVGAGVEKEFDVL